MDEKPTLLQRLLPELAQSGATKECAGSLPCEWLNVGSRSFKLDDGISYEVTLTNTGGGVLLTGTARVAGVTECDRCLEDAAFEVSGEVSAYFILHPDRLDDELADDESVPVGTDSTVDLAVPIIAAVISEMPLALLCRDDCAGLCPSCGANLNEELCDCAARAVPDGPFAALSSLKGE
ncbi:MAG: YceD family protein [Coriobacteriales bacterium]|jgi:uncharacterized protein|nr:YceD family protein [Coriobacteriales bacterium]